MSDRCRVSMTDIPVPPTLGLVLAGGLARRMGGGDKARLEIGGITILDRVLATLSGQCVDIVINANGDPQALRRHRLRRGARQCRGPSRPARRHSRRARLAGAAEQRHRVDPERAGRLPVSARRSGGKAAHGAAQDGHRRAACLRALRRMAASGRGPYGRWRCAKICARRWCRTTCARSKCGRRSTASPSPTGRSSRSIHFSM